MPLRICGEGDWQARTLLTSSIYHYRFVVRETGGPWTPLGHPKDISHFAAELRLLRAILMDKNGFCHLLPRMWPGLPHSPHTGHYSGSRGPRRAASPRTRALERDRMELGRFALPHRTNKLPNYSTHRTG